MNWFSATEGLACDSVLEYKIVLPTGEIARASETSNVDLYKALKGAGQSNFGIVTEFTLEVFELPNPKGIWFSSRTFLPDKMPAIREAHQKWLTGTMATSASSTGQFQAWGWMPDYGSLTILVQFDTNHNSLDTFSPAFEHYQSIDSVPQGDELLMLSPSNFSLKLDASNPYGFRNRYATFCFKPSADLEAKFYELFEAALEKIKGVDSWGFALVMQPIAQATMAKTVKHGGNVLGLKEEDGPLVIWHIPWAWREAKDDTLMLEVAQDLFEKSEAAAKDMGLWHPYKYINYAAEWEPVFEGYGEENHKWLKEMQRKIDPEQIFTLGGLASGGFKLNKKTEEHSRARDEL